MSSMLDCAHIILVENSFNKYIDHMYKILDAVMQISYNYINYHYLAISHLNFKYVLCDYIIFNVIF